MSNIIRNWCFVSTNGRNQSFCRAYVTRDSTSGFEQKLQGAVSGHKCSTYVINHCAARTSTPAITLTLVCLSAAHVLSLIVTRTSRLTPEVTLCRRVPCRVLLSVMAPTRCARIGYLQRRRHKSCSAHVIGYPGASQPPHATGSESPYLVSAQWPKVIKCNTCYQSW